MITKKIILFLSCFLPIKLLSQESAPLILLNNKSVHLSPINEQIIEKIIHVKIAKIQFKGKVEGYGKANIIRIAGLNYFLQKNKYRPIGNIPCSIYVTQGNNTQYIRSYTFYNGKKESILNGWLYEVTTARTKYTFVIMK